MARVALVTGGSRGIGAAISMGLKKRVIQSRPIMLAMTKRPHHLQKKQVSQPINGTFQIMMLALPESLRLKPRMVRLKFSSIMPASRVMRCSTK